MVESISVNLQARVFEAEWNDTGAEFCPPGGLEERGRREFGLVLAGSILLAWS
jgi:hypothetical protein